MTVSDGACESGPAEQKHEKLVTLGKLSAGLAHELNNPAAAARRAASELRERLDALRELTLALVEQRLAPAEAGAIAELRRVTAEREAVRALPDAVVGAPLGTPFGAPLSALELSEREDELVDWLGSRGVARAWVAAATLVGAGLAVPDLEALAKRGSPSALAGAVAWLESGVAADALVVEIESIARRIAELVSTVKSYSHMGEASGKGTTDVHAGINSTLAMLAYKIRSASVTVSREYAAELPPIRAYAGELSQVWTNLLDNALDAAPGGQVNIRTRREGEDVVVEIHDDGPGVPPDIRERIWEPFFSTKDADTGTGLGLGIARHIVVRRHRGDIQLSSVPGDTCFKVRLPIEAPASGAAPDR